MLRDALHVRYSMSLLLTRTVMFVFYNREQMINVQILCWICRSPTGFTTAHVEASSVGPSTVI